MTDHKQAQDCPDRRGQCRGHGTPAHRPYLGISEDTTGGAGNALYAIFMGLAIALAVTIITGGTIR